MPERLGVGKRPSASQEEVSPPPAKRRQQSHTTSAQQLIRRLRWLTRVAGKAVASFFTPMSRKEPEKMTWRIVKDSLLVGRYNTSATVQSASKVKRRIAAFDFVRIPAPTTCL